METGGLRQRKTVIRIARLGLRLPAASGPYSLKAWKANESVAMDAFPGARHAAVQMKRVIIRHVLPNAMGTIIVSATLTIASAILLEAALSFLGFGVRPPDTSLGLLISTYQNAFTTRPWLFWWPGLFIIVIALSINFIGDGLRDALDPRQTRVRA